MKRAVWIRVVVLVSLVLITPLCLKSQRTHLDRVSTMCGSGWVPWLVCEFPIDFESAGLTHPLPQVVLTRSNIGLQPVRQRPVMGLSQTVKAPALIVKDIKGRTFRLSDHKDKVVLINFWATWCPPCRAEIPELIKLQRQYRSSGLQIVGITYPPQKLSAVRNFSAKLRINYPLALGTRATKLLFTRSETLPLTIVIDRAGNVVEIIEGILLPEEFENKVRPLLSSSK